MNLGLWQYRLRACCGLRFTVKVKASIGGFLRHGGEAGFIGMSDIRTSRLFIELRQNSSEISLQSDINNCKHPCGMKRVIILKTSVLIKTLAR